MTPEKAMAMLKFGIEERFWATTTHNGQPAIVIKNCHDASNRGNATKILCQGIGHVLTNIKNYCDTDWDFATTKEFALACNNFEACYEGSDLIVWSRCEKKHVESTPSDHDKGDTFKLLAAAADNVATRSYCILYSLGKNMIAFDSEKNFFYAIGLCVMQFETYAHQINTSQTLEEFAVSVNRLHLNWNVKDSQVYYFFNE